MAKQIHLTQATGRISTILINKTDLGTSEWKNVFDSRWIGSADEIIEFIEAGIISRDKVAKRKVIPEKNAKVPSNQPLMTEKFPIIKKVSNTNPGKKVIKVLESHKENGIKGISTESDVSHGKKKADITSTMKLSPSLSLSYSPNKQLSSRRSARPLNELFIGSKVSV